MNMKNNEKHELHDKMNIKWNQSPQAPQLDSWQDSDGIFFDSFWILFDF